MHMARVLLAALYTLPSSTMIPTSEFVRVSLISFTVMSVERECSECSQRLVSMFV